VHGGYGTMPAKLRINITARPSVEKVDFGPWSLAVSTVNGCGMCMESPEKVVHGHRVTAEQVQATIRSAAVVHAVASVLNGADALARDA
jgi:alkyl hydroperoxide reductase subunit D